MKPVFNKLLIPLLLVTCFGIFIGSVSGQTYCIPTFINGCSNWHNDTITLNTLNWAIDTTYCSTYDFTSLSTTLNTGVAYPMQVASSYFTGCSVWIDLDNDGIFEPGENLYHGYLAPASGHITYSFTVTIPSGTSTGAHRMRVLSAWATDGFTSSSNGYGPCGTVAYQYGNFDDFTVNIDCTSPTAGTISGPDTVYLGSSITLSDTTAGGIWAGSNTTLATVDPSLGLIIPSATGTDTITYTVTNSCGTATATKIITISSLDGISGHVYLGSAPCTGSNITIRLITYDTATHNLAATDSVILPRGTSGIYHQFTGIPTDSFRIKAATSNDSLYTYTGYVPTYHTSNFYWNAATVLYNTAGTADTGQNINMAYGTVAPGPGFIAGNVTMGANKGTATAIPPRPAHICPQPGYRHTGAANIYRCQWQLCLQ